MGLYATLYGFYSRRRGARAATRGRDYSLTTLIKRLPKRRARLMDRSIFIASLYERPLEGRGVYFTVF